MHVNSSYHTEQLHRLCVLFFESRRIKYLKEKKNNRAKHIHRAHRSRRAHIVWTRAWTLWEYQIHKKIVDVLVYIWISGKSLVIQSVFIFFFRLFHSSSIAAVTVVVVLLDSRILHLGFGCHRRCCRYYCCCSCIMLFFSILYICLTVNVFFRRTEKKKQTHSDRVRDTLNGCSLSHLINESFTFVPTDTGCGSWVSVW